MPVWDLYDLYVFVVVVQVKLSYNLAKVAEKSLYIYIYILIGFWFASPYLVILIFWILVFDFISSEFLFNPGPKTPPLYLCSRPPPLVPFIHFRRQKWLPLKSQLKIGHQTTAPLKLSVLFAFHYLSLLFVSLGLRYDFCKLNLAS